MILKRKFKIRRNKFCQGPPKVVPEKKINTSNENPGRSSILKFIFPYTPMLKTNSIFFFKSKKPKLKILKNKFCEGPPKVVAEKHWTSSKKNCRRSSVLKKKQEGQRP